VESGCLTRYRSKRNVLILLRLLLPALAFLAGCTAFSVSQGPQLKLDEVHPFGATSLAFSPSGDRLASGGLLGEVMIWAVPSGRRLAVLKAHHQPVRDLLWIDRDHLVSRDEGGGMFVWETSSPGVVDALSGQHVTAIAWSPQRRRLIVGDAEGRLRSLGYPGLAPLADTGVDTGVLELAVAADGTQTAVLTADGRVLLYDAGLRFLRPVEQPPGKVYELRFSPDGRQLAGGGWFKLFLWNVATGRLQVRSVEHTGAVVSLDYSPDGKHMATLGRIFDGRLLITDAASGTVLRRLYSPPLCGWKVRYSPDGRIVSASSENGSVYLYDVSASYQPTWYHH
jgi:hypothetical protein